MSKKLPIGKKTYQYLKDKDAPHMGGLLHRHLKSKRIPARQLSFRLNRSPNTIQAYFKNPSLQLLIVWEICKALEYNFLQI